MMDFSVLDGYSYENQNSKSNNSDLLYKINRCGCSSNISNFNIQRNKDYAYYTVHILFEGCGFFRIGAKDYLLKKGDIFIITAGEEHTYSSMPDSDFGVLWIEFYGSNCRELLSVFKNNDFYVISHNDKITSRLSDILIHLKNDPDCNEFELSSLIYSFIMSLLENANETFKENFHQVVADALRIIHNDFLQNLSISDMAKRLHVSHTYLTEQFKKMIGTTPSKYINLKKIEYACFLLQTTGLTCEEITDKIGLYDNAYFHKTFKMVTGTTPIKYRSNNE